MDYIFNWFKSSEKTGEQLAIELIEAVIASDVEDVKSLLERRADPTFEVKRHPDDDEKQSALSVAAARSTVEIFDMLCSVVHYHEHTIFIGPPNFWICYNQCVELTRISAKHDNINVLHYWMSGHPRFKNGEDVGGVPDFEYIRDRVNGTNIKQYCRTCETFPKIKNCTGQSIMSLLVLWPIDSTFKLKLNIINSVTTEETFTTLYHSIGTHANNFFQELYALAESMFLYDTMNILFKVSGGAAWTFETMRRSLRKIDSPIFMESDREHTVLNVMMSHWCSIIEERLNSDRANMRGIIDTHMVNLVLHHYSVFESSGVDQIVNAYTASLLIELPDFDVISRSIGEEYLTMLYQPIGPATAQMLHNRIRITLMLSNFTSVLGNRCVYEVNTIVENQMFKSILTASSGENSYMIYVNNKGNSVKLELYTDVDVLKRQLHNLLKVVTIYRCFYVPTYLTDESFRVIGQCLTGVRWETDDAERKQGTIFDLLLDENNYRNQSSLVALAALVNFQIPGEKAITIGPDNYHQILPESMLRVIHTIATLKLIDNCVWNSISNELLFLIMEALV